MRPRLRALTSSAPKTYVEMFRPRDRISTRIATPYMMPLCRPPSVSAGPARHDADPKIRHGDDDVTPHLNGAKGGFVGIRVEKAGGAIVQPSSARLRSRKIKLVENVKKALTDAVAKASPQALRHLHPARWRFLLHMDRA